MDQGEREREERKIKESKEWRTKRGRAKRELRECMAQMAGFSRNEKLREWG